MTMDVYRDRIDGEWHWRIITGNGRVVGRSPHGYKRKNACVDIARTISKGCDRMSIES